MHRIIASKALAVMAALAFASPALAQQAATPTEPSAAAAAESGSTLVGGAGASPVLPGMTATAATADYPTVTAADYIFGCMASNGQTRVALERCSCSFDVVASLISYDRYVEASTFLSMGQVTGEKGVLFKTSAESKAAIGDLRRDSLLRIRPRPPGRSAEPRDQRPQSMTRLSVTIAARSRSWGSVGTRSASCASKAMPISRGMMPFSSNRSMARS